MEEKPVPPPLITRPMNTSSGSDWPPTWVFVVAALICAAVIGYSLLNGCR